MLTPLLVIPLPYRSDIAGTSRIELSILHSITNVRIHFSDIPVFKSSLNRSI